MLALEIPDYHEMGHLFSFVEAGGEINKVGARMGSKWETIDSLALI
jgi:hypothetical protein